MDLIEPSSESHFVFTRGETTLRLARVWKVAAHVQRNQIVMTADRDTGIGRELTLEIGEFQILGFKPRNVYEAVAVLDDIVSGGIIE